MEIKLKSHGVRLSEELRQHIERRVYFGLRRFASRIRSLTIRLRDSNGPRGGVDQCCDVRVDVGLSHAVIVRERQENMFAAVALAVERAERAVRRLVSAQRATRYGPQADTIQ